MTHDCAEEICEMSDDNVDKEEGAVVGGQEGVGGQSSTEILKYRGIKSVGIDCFKSR